jgi:hypothetical protein
MAHPHVDRTHTSLGTASMSSFCSNDSFGRPKLHSPSRACLRSLKCARSVHYALASRPRSPAAEQHPPMDCTQQGFVVAGSSASLQSIPVPTPKEGEAVVRVLIAGVCNTDLEIMKGATRS